MGSLDKILRSFPLPYLLGLDVGSGATWAAICRRAPGASGWAPPEPVATDAPPAVSGLLRRVGDEVPVYCDNLLITPQALVVEQARAAADQVWQREGEGPERIAVAHPSAWGRGRVGLLRAAFGDAGMSNVVLVSRAAAVVQGHEGAGRPVAVCRIGRASVEVTLLLSDESRPFETLGVTSSDELGGEDLAEPGSAGALIDLVRHAVTAARVELGALAAVLAAGGGAAHPLVAEALAEATPAPVIREADPWLTVARGAALALRPRAVAAAAPLVLPTELLPVTDSRLGVSELGPGEMPARPPIQVATLPLGAR